VGTAHTSSGRERSTIPDMIETQAGWPKRERVLGQPVHCVGAAEAMALVGRCIAERRPCRIIVTNANKAWLASRDARLRTILEEAELVIPEYATAWAARRLSRPDVRYVGGQRLMRQLLAAAPGRGWSVYFLGGAAGVVEAMVGKLRAATPGLRIVGHHHGYLDDAAWRNIREELATLKPDLLFLGMGSPLQEYRMWELPAGPLICLGVGGSFDVLSGRKKDAPGWMQGRGLEWLYRLGQDPRNLWRRYAITNPWFVWSVLRERVTGSTPGGTRT
jgi:N-acetylglucosaminyldiphosphoundecaprenol N-acetyl-beta-D-mannosaminyltransferase